MKLHELIVTIFFLGKVSFAPGTLASLATSIFFYIFLQEMNFSSILIIILIIFVLASYSVSAYTQGFTDKDKSEIVIDEVLGQLISLTPIILYKSYLNNAFIWICASFIIFRFFDIIKPQPIKYFDNINKAWAVIFDDVVAGLTSAIALIALIELVAS